MKHFLCFTLFTCLFFASCVKPSYEFNETEMKTLGKKTVLLKSENVMIIPEAGFGYVLTDTMLEMIKNGTIEIFELSNDCVKFVAYSEELLDLIQVLDPAEINEEQIQDFTVSMMQYVFEACCIIKADKETEQEEALAKYSALYSNAEKIAKTDTFVYYFLYNNTFSGITLANDEKDTFSKLTEELETFEDNIIVFNPVVAE